MMFLDRALADDLGDNCGVRLCSWIYSLCNSIIRTFTDDDISSVRIIIANILCQFGNYASSKTASSKRKELRIIKPQETLLNYNLRIKTDESHDVLCMTSTFEMCASLNAIVDSIG